MNTPSESDLALREARLDAIVAQYLQAREKGLAPDRDDWIARYPDYVDELKAFFADESKLRRLVGATSQPPQFNSQGKKSVGHHDSAVTGSSWIPPPEIRRDEIRTGSVFAGLFKIFDVKSGGMGRVYLADVLSDSSSPLKGIGRVAIKTVADFEEWCEAQHQPRRPVDHAQHAGLVARFLREAELLVRLGPLENIVRAYFVLDVGAKPYLIMEYLSGGDLAGWIAESRLTVPLAINFGIQFCNGMIQAIRAGSLIHRDIKPANILLTPGGYLKISDYGLAKAFFESVETSGLCSQSSGALLSMGGGGSAPYMAPEQFEDFARVDTGADIFSFGAVLFEMATGRRLFEGRTWDEQYMLRRKPIPIAHQINPSVPARLSQIIARCVRYNRAERYLSFDEVRAELHKLNDEVPGCIPLPASRPTTRAATISESDRLTALAYSYLGLREFEKAAAVAEEGTRVAPDNAGHFINRGVALAELANQENGAGERRRGLYREAARCFLRATKLNSADPKAYSNLAWAMKELGETREALRIMEMGARLHPTSGDVWFAKGSCEMALGYNIEAKTSLSRAARFDPSNWKINRDLGICLEKLDKHDQALATLTFAARINPDDWLVWYWIAIARGAQKLIPEAKHAIGKALALDPPVGDPWVLAAYLCSDAERHTARTYLRTALEREPDNENAKELLARIDRKIPVLRAQDRGDQT